MTLLVGCYPVSHVIVGEARMPIEPSMVKIFADYPDEYEKIALVDAGSSFALKDPAVLFTWQSKMDKVIERLKIEAAQLGANGMCALLCPLGAVLFYAGVDALMV